MTGLATWWNAAPADLVRIIGERAAAVVAPAERPRRAGQTFRGYADFTRAYDAAKAAAGGLDSGWWGWPDSISARVPAAWVACRVTGRVSSSPRDMRFPPARYWPGGALPVGPDYAEPVDFTPRATVRITSMVTGATADLYAIEVPGWLGQQEAIGRAAMRNPRIGAEYADAAD